MLQFAAAGDISFIEDPHVYRSSHPLDTKMWKRSSLLIMPRFAVDLSKLVSFSSLLFVLSTTIGDVLG
jgi:hypothetical protein